MQRWEAVRERLVSLRWALLSHQMAQIHPFQGAWSISSVSVMGPQLLRLSDSSLDSPLDPGCRPYPVLFNPG